MVKGTMSGSEEVEERTDQGGTLNQLEQIVVGLD